MRNRRLILLLAALLSFVFCAVSASAPFARQPQFVVDAERSYAQARRALANARDRVDWLRRKEVRESRAAMARAGQWIEPEALWQAQRAAEQNLAFAQTQATQALDDLNQARDRARRIRVGPIPQPEPLSDPFWELR